jgi:hypothetical protein
VEIFITAGSLAFRFGASAMTGITLVCSFWHRPTPLIGYSLLNADHFMLPGGVTADGLLPSPYDRPDWCFSRLYRP